MDNSKQLFLITGSSGFLGQALSRHFLSEDNKIVGFDKESPPEQAQNTQCLFCDLSSDESVQKTFALLRARDGKKITGVFHLAAYYSFSGEDWKTYSVPKPIAKVGAFLEGEIPFVEKPFVKPWMVDRADDNYQLDLDKAKTILGWSPENRLHDVIPKMIANLKSDPVAWYKINHLNAPGWPEDRAKAGLTAKAKG